MDVASPTVSLASFGRRLWQFAVRRSGWLFLGLILGVLVFVQWPMLKGAVYPLLGIELPESRIDWKTDFDAALEGAATTDRLVLLDFTASWCPPCRAMNYSTWPDSRVEELVGEHFVPVMVDVDQPRNAAVVNTYDIRGMPTILIVDATGRQLARGNYMSAGGMADFLEKQIH